MVAAGAAAAVAVAVAAAAAAVAAAGDYGCGWDVTGHWPGDAAG